MARIPQFTTEKYLSADQQDAFDEISASRGQISGPFSVLLNSPELARRAAHLGAYIRFESVLSDQTRELAIITVAREMNCSYEWKAHTEIAKKVGISAGTINNVAVGADLSSFTESEALVVAYGRQILNCKRVAPDTFRSALTRYGNKGVTELTTTIGYYAMLACTLNAFEVVPETGSMQSS